MARIRPNSNPNQPIPNNPFYTPETTYLGGPYYPAIIDSTSGITIGPDGLITVTGGGGAVSGIFAGTGISVSGNTGNVTITNTGVTNITAGTGITLSANTGSITISASGGTGTVTTVNSGTGLTGGPITTSGTLSLTSTGVTPASYTNANVTVDAQGRITAASSNIVVSSVSGSSPISVSPGTTPVVSIAAATLTNPGAVQLSNSTTSTSDSEAATPSAVKVAFDAAAAAIPKTCLIGPGGIVTSTATGIPVALPVGADGLVLTADSACVEGIKWAAAGSGASGTVTSVATTAALTGGPITTSGTLDLAITGVTANTYNYPTALSVDACGRITSLSTLPSSPVLPSDFQAKGDILAATGVGAFSDLTVGADGTVLTADSSTATGLKWAPAGGTGTVTSVATSAALTGGPITTTGTLDLATTAVTAGSYTYSALTVDACGRVTAASNGSDPICKVEVTAKGDIIAGTGVGTICALGVGTDGQILYADSASAAGVCWGVAPSGSAPATPTVAGIVLGCTTATNTAVGCNALLSAGGTFNAAIGISAGSALTGNSNVAIGRLALGQATNTGGNIAIGESAIGGPALVSGGGNIGIGGSVLSLVSGSGNIAIGSQAGSQLGAGDFNHFIGFRAGRNQTAGCYNVAIGDQVNVANLTGDCQLALGFANGQNWLTGDSTKAIQPGAGIIDCAGSCGAAGEVLMSDGANAICWGAASGVSAATPTTAGVMYGCTTTTNGPVKLGHNAAPTATAICSIYIGKDAGCALTVGGGSSIVIGHCSLTTATLSSNVNIVIGSGAAQAVTTAGGNIALGEGSIPALTTGNHNIVIGRGGALNLATGNCNILIGRAVALNTTTDDNIIIGNLLCAPNGTGKELAIGYGGGGTNSYWLTGDNTLAIKPGAGIIDCAGSCGAAGQLLASDGANAICWTTLTVPSDATPASAGTIKGCTNNASENTFLGSVSGSAITTGFENTIVGSNTAIALTTGYCNTVMGACAMQAATDARWNVAIGVCALLSTTIGQSNTAIGNGALEVGANVSGNVAIGRSSLSSLTAGGVNVGVGNEAGWLLATGFRNVLVGYQAGRNLTSGSCNISIGDGSALPNATGDNQLALGNFNGNWLTGNSTFAIEPGAGIIDCASSCGTANQVLTSQGNAIEWKSVNFALAAPNYGSFLGVPSQTATSGVNTGIPVLLPTTLAASGFSIVSNSQITAANAGIYNLQFSVQILSTGGGGGNVEIWLTKNGSLVPNTNTRFIIQNQNEAEFAALNYVESLNAGDYLELYWGTTNANIELHFSTSTMVPPGPNIPAVILTIVPVGA